MKKIFIFLFLTCLLSSNEIYTPFTVLKSSGAVVDMVYHDNKLYSATDAGCVDIFDMNTKQIIEKIQVDKITDFMGDIIDSKVYSVDVLKDKVLVLSETKNGFRRVHIRTSDTTELLIDYSASLAIAKAKFLDENTLILALLSNELISYDIQNKKQNWLIQVSQSKFSNFVLNENKTELIVADESGDLKVHSTKDGKFLKKYSGQNVDNVFDLDTKRTTIATAGQDRRVVIYDTASNSAYYKTSSFLIYSVALSPSAKLAAYSSDENNNITVFDTTTKQVIGVYGGNNMTVSKILFFNENEFLVSTHDTKINLYKIKER